MTETVRIDPTQIPDSAYDVASSILAKLLPKFEEYLKSHPEQHEEWLKSEAGQKALRRSEEIERGEYKWVH